MIHKPSIEASIHYSRVGFVMFCIVTAFTCSVTSNEVTPGSVGGVALVARVTEAAGRGRGRIVGANMDEQWLIGIER